MSWAGAWFTRRRRTWASASGGRDGAWPPRAQIWLPGWIAVILDGRGRSWGPVQFAPTWRCIAPRWRYAQGMDRQIIKSPPRQALHPQVLLERVALGIAPESELLAELGRRTDEVRQRREALVAKVRDGAPLTPEERWLVLASLEAHA